MTTSQPGPGLPFALHETQQRRKLQLFGLSVVFLVSLLFVASSWEGESLFYDGIETFGIVLIGLCVAGRSWCTLYIGGHKNDELIHAGPYSVARNPLYIFSFMGAAGIGACTGSLLISLLMAAICFPVFYFVVIREEQSLQNTFGAPYKDYLERVPRFIPDFRLWQDAESLHVNPQLVAKTFFEACLFFLAYPFFELTEYYQELGWLPIILELP